MMYTVGSAMGPTLDAWRVGVLPPPDDRDRGQDSVPKRFRPLWQAYSGVGSAAQ